MDKIYILDIETEGTNKLEDKIIEVSLLEANYDKVEKIFRPNKSFDYYFFNDGSKMSDFAKEHQVELFDKCRNIPLKENAHEICLNEIIKFCEIKEGNFPTLAGWNLGTFDIPFCEEQIGLELLRFKLNPQTGKRDRVGHFHYRVIDIQTLAWAKMLDEGIERDEFEKRALKEFPLNMKMIPKEQKSHWGLFDCHKELSYLNYSLK
ncbi:MAG: hypothetical protein GY909_15560 [Oligoflexia bacterium]|nr:hypothetical protein [Oligoflexia bacterium]